MSVTIYCADCETDPFDGVTIPEPFIWGITDGDDYEEFDTVESFVCFCEGSPGICYAHNGGKFDWLFLLGHIPTFEPLTVINGRLARFKIGEMEFRDSWCILPVPLRTFAKDDFDYSILARDKRYMPGNFDKIRAYLRSDCMNLYAAVSQFIEQYGLKLTLAGTALAQWKIISGQKPDETDGSYYDYMSRYYYGGRTECFKKGIIDYPCTMLDINSAYPFAMLHEHPAGTLYTEQKHLPETEDEIARCFITLTAQSFGALPFRGKNGLSFPNDGIVREYHCTGWEYLAGLRTGTLVPKQVTNVVRFWAIINFRSYVDHFYTMKNNAEKGSAQYIFAKLFLNSLYGKFAMNPENYDEFIILPGDCAEGSSVDGYMPCLAVGDKILMSRPLPEEKHKYLNVAIAASITGFVRAYLWEHIGKCDGVIYCDTDSIIARAHAGFEISDRLGAWGIDGEFERGAVAGKKLYTFTTKKGKHKTASKGCRLTPKEIEKIARGETVTYHPEAPSFSVHRPAMFVPRNIKMT